MAYSKSAKTFVLDTNVILHDPTCINQFQENNIVIPLAVIEDSWLEFPPASVNSIIQNYFMVIIIPVIYARINF